MFLRETIEQMIPSISEKVYKSMELWLKKSVSRVCKFLLHDLLVKLDEENYSAKSGHASRCQILNIDRKHRVPINILASWVFLDTLEELVSPIYQVLWYTYKRSTVIKTTSNRKIHIHQISLLLFIICKEINEESMMFIQFVTIRISYCFTGCNWIVILDKNITETQ